MAHCRGRPRSRGTGGTHARARARTSRRQSPASYALCIILSISIIYMAKRKLSSLFAARKLFFSQYRHIWAPAPYICIRKFSLAVLRDRRPQARRPVDVRCQCQSGVCAQKITLLTSIHVRLALRRIHSSDMQLPATKTRSVHVLRGRASNHSAATFVVIVMSC
jgi:hypothetical protein